MKVARILDMLEDIESRFPVSQWEIGGIQIWPWLRVANTWRWDDFVNQGGSTARAAGFWKRVASGFQTLERLRSDRRLSRLDRAAQSRPERPVHAVFWEITSNRRFKVQERHYSVFSDPIRDLLEREGLGSFVYETGRDGVYRHPRYRDSFPCYSRFYRIGLINRLRPIYSVDDVLRLPGFSQFQDYLSRQPLERPAYSPTEIARCVSLLRRMADRFRRDFAVLRPKVALMFGYYEWETMALCQACREEGLLSIDVQHGVQSRYHPAYARWRSVPVEGYSLMPEVFWVWGEDDAAIIDEWNDPCRPRHRAVVGGNLGLEMFYSDTNPVARGFDEEVSRVIPHGTTVRVLMALQWSRELSDLMKQVLRQSPPSWQWLIRLHPQDAEKVGEFEVVLRAVRGHGVNVAQATGLPLPAVIRNVDAVMTEGSSVVVEAEAFGVGSVIIDRPSEIFFEQSVRNGTAVVADQSEQVLAAIEALAAKRSQPAKKTLGSRDSILRILKSGTVDFPA